MRAPAFIIAIVIGSLLGAPPLVAQGDSAGLDRSTAQRLIDTWRELTAERAQSAPAAAVRVQTGAPPVGVGTHALDRSSISHLSDLGVRHLRTTLYWSHWHDPAYRREFAAGLQRAHAAGIRPLVVVHQQPSGGYASRQRVYRDFAAFMEARAAQFPEVEAWQLWNEMDVGFTDVFGAGRGVPMRQRGRNYAEMLRLAYPAIKRGNPNALVVTGGIASGPRDGFLHGMYEGGGRFDVLAIHSYGFPVVGPYRDRGREARRIMREHGDDRPLWNTEFGMEDAVVPPGWDRSRSEIDRHHRGAWKESIELNAQEGIYARSYGHVLKQGGDLSFDLVRRDGSSRPAYTWLRGYLRGR